MKSITYNAGKFLLDGNEIVNPELLKQRMPYAIFVPGDTMSFPATLRAEVEWQYLERGTGIWKSCHKEEWDAVEFISPSSARKVVRLVEVESKPLDDNEQYKANIEACHEDHKKHLDKKRTGILAVGEADYEPAFPESKSLIESALPPHEPTPDAPEMQGTFMKMVDAEIEPEKQAIDERVEFNLPADVVIDLQRIALADDEMCPEACRHYREIVRDILRRSSQPPKAIDETDEIQADLYKYGVAYELREGKSIIRLDPTKITLRSSQPPPQAESQDELWMNVCVETYAIERIGASKVIRILKEKFTINPKH